MSSSIVVEDGCRDRTRQLLEERSRSPWGRRCLRWVHEDNVHELRSTNRGFREARAPLVMAWQDDMFLRVPWLVPGAPAHLRSLRRPRPAVPEPRAELHPDRRTDRDLGRPGRLAASAEHDRTAPAQLDPPPGGRHRHSPVGGPPGVPRSVGLLDEAFVPTEWDEADLSFRIRAARLESGDARLRAARRVLPPWQHDGRCAVGGVQAACREQRAAVPRPLGRRHSPRRRRVRGAPGGVVRPPRWMGSHLDGGGEGSRRRDRRSQWPSGNHSMTERRPLPTAPAGRYRGRSLMDAAGERLRGLPLGSRFRGWGRAAYHAAWMLQTGGRGLSCTLPSGELVRVLPEHRYMSWNPIEYAAFRDAVRSGYGRARRRRECRRLRGAARPVGGRIGTGVRVRAARRRRFDGLVAPHRTERSGRRRHARRGGGRRSRRCGRSDRC